MGKRKDGDDDGRNSDLQPPIKRIRRGFGTPLSLVDQMKICQDILENLRTHKTEDGRLLAENFLRAPSRRISPEYHKLVASPMDMMQIQRKLKNDEYESVDQYVADVKSLSENAKSFYKKNSQEYKDAVELWHLFLESKARLLDVDEMSEASGRSRESSPAQSTRSLRSNSPGRSTRSKDTSPGRFTLSGNDTLDKSYLEEYLAGLLLLTDENGRNICLAFGTLPSREEYPDYYNVITCPIDLITIATKLRKGMYKNLNSIQRDLQMLCRNAKTFNEPKSNIYKDANFLKKAVDNNKADILEMATRPMDKARAAHASAVIDELIRSPRSTEFMEPTVTVDDLEEDSEEEEVKFSNTRIGHYWRMYWTARDYKESGQLTRLSEPFCRLPSKKTYPDYYEEIKNPISMFMINRKIKNGEYERFVELVDDLNLMFNNAKFYNIEESPIYDAACKLQGVTNQTALEIDPTIDISQYNVEIPTDTAYGQDDEESDGSMTSSAVKPKRKRRLGKGNLDEQMNAYRNKLLAAYNSIVQAKDQVGRWLAEAFMEKPSRKLYPDYYNVIPDPIDLKTIKAKIDNDKYDNLSSLASDVDLLFSNARHYNEEDSQIYNDANILESIFKKANEKYGDRGLESPKAHLSGVMRSKSTIPKDGGRPISSGSASGGISDLLSRSYLVSPATMAKFPKQRSSGDIIKRRKMWNLYEAINDYTDSKGTKLSLIFSKLPSKTAYPDYYEIIKMPIDLQKIHSRLSAKAYDTLESLVQDFNLMFDNACKYNDPESTIYKSALTLQRVLLEKKQEFQEEEMDGKVPDVQTAVQELLTTLFIAVYNHEDEEGRCFSDSLAELPDLFKDAEPNAPLLSLDDIKHRLDKGRYRRLDRFQEDVFEVFNKARLLSRSDSQLFEDATELQNFFIITRNDLCKNGDAFTSPASRFTEKDLAALVEEQRKEKQPCECKEDAAKSDDPRMCPSERKEGDTELQSITVNDVTYSKGDFVYVKPNDDKLERHILRVERIWRDGGLRQEFVSGNWYYRPYETYHLATRKFLEKEIFRTEFYDGVDAQRLVGKCYVMFIKDYFKYRPQEFDDKDVFVCESKYLGRVKHFKKIKYWHIDMDAERVTFVERTKPVEAARTVPSVFATATPSEIRGHGDDEEEEDYAVLERKQEEIVIDAASSDPANASIYYKKINHNGMWLKVGDGVYIDGPGRKSDVIRIESLWRSAQNEAFMKGTVFVRPHSMTGVDPSHSYYRQELFATERCSTLPLSLATGKCVVLSVEDYVSLRPTEINEKDVYISESVVRLLPTADPSGNQYHVTSEPPIFLQFPMPNIVLSPALDDEYYHFKRHMRLEKETLEAIIKRETDAERTTSVLSDVVAEIDSSDLSFLKGLHTTPKLGARSKSGYILFSAVVRKGIMKENPACAFGEISKIVGQEWKKLSEEDKKRYEEEAARIAQEREKADAASGGKQTVQPGQIRVYCCKWKECDYQFETTDQLYDHITTAHTSQIAVPGENVNQYICLWLTCAKYRKDGKPFPSLPRLHRHIKDKHLPTSSKCIQPQNKSKHFVPLVPPQSTTPQSSPNGAEHSQQPHTTAAGQSTPGQGVQHAASSQPQVVYYQQQASGQAGHVLLDAQGNVVQGQQVVIYQVQQPGQAPVAVNAAQVQPMVGNAAAESSHQQLLNQDPGRVVVQAPQKPAEPVFVAPPKQRIQRVLHSDIYLRYINGLATQQPTISRWDRQLGSVNHPPPIPNRNLPTHVFHRLPETKEELSQTLLNLREHMMKDTLGIKRILDSTSAYL